MGACEAPAFQAALAAGNAGNGGAIVGEAVGLIHAIVPATAILERMVAESEALLKGAPGYVEPT